MPVRTLTNAYREQYVCMDSSCAECAIDAWTLLVIITSSRRGGTPEGWVRVCVCVCVCVCVWGGVILDSQLAFFESWIVAMSESVKLLFISLKSILMVERGRFDGRRGRQMERKQQTLQDSRIQRGQIIDWETENQNVTSAVLNDGPKSQRGKNWLRVLFLVLQGLDSKFVPVIPLVKNALTKRAAEVWENTSPEKSLIPHQTWAATF